MFFFNSYLQNQHSEMNNNVKFQLRILILSLLIIYFFNLSFAFGQNPISTNDVSSYTILVDISEDTYVNRIEPDLNYGFGEEFRVGRGFIEYYRSYLKFDLTRLPKGKTIMSANLRLSRKGGTIAGALVGAHYLDDDTWEEGSITWNNCPMNFNSTPTDTVLTNSDFVYWDVTEDVIDAYNGDGVYSVVLKASDEYDDKWVYFWSKSCSSFTEWGMLEVEFSGTKYGGGSGTVEDPFLICTAEQLSQISDNPEDWEQHFKLTSDIDLSGFTGYQFHIISNDWQNPFQGVFNGNGHVIYNFNYEVPDYAFVNYVGLFGCIGPNSIISNLGLENPNVYGGANGTGPLSGLIFSGLVQNCWASDVNIYGNFRSGGLVGEVYEGQIKDSYAKGGFVGVEYNHAGGLVGQNEGHIIRCYSTCLIGRTGSWWGGLVADSSDGTVTNSFWDKEASDITWSDGGTGKTTSQMRKKSTFTDAGWDFVDETENGILDYWRMCVDGVKYPLLSWQFTPDFTCPDGVDFLDLAFLIERWLAECDETNNFCNCTDVNYDDLVNFLDFAILADHWLQQ